MNEKLLYTVPEAARLSGIGRNALYELVRAKRIPCIKIGNRYLVSAEGLTDWVRTAGENHEEINV